MSSTQAASSFDGMPKPNPQDDVLTSVGSLMHIEYVAGQICLMIRSTTAA